MIFLQGLFSCLTAFLYELVAFEGFIYVAAAMTVCGVAVLLISFFRSEKS